MSFPSSPSTSWILLTGQPGSGKTTSLLTLLPSLAQLAPHLKQTGFYTPEVKSASLSPRQQHKLATPLKLTPRMSPSARRAAPHPFKNGSRVGFDIVSIPTGDRGVLSRLNGPKNHPKTGAYSVDVESFSNIALRSLPGPDDGDDGGLEDTVVVLDEIGRMELHSVEFQDRIKYLLRKGCKLLGCITAPIYGHRVPFCDLVEGSVGVRVRRLKKSNRDEVVEGIRKEVRELWGEGKRESELHGGGKGKRRKIV